MSSNKIYVQSSLRNSGSSSEFNINLSRPVFNVKKVQVSEVLIPNVFYNITSSNNTIIVDEGKGAQSSSITVGQYDITSLLSALKTALDGNNVLSGIFTCSYSTVTYKVTISSTVAFSITYGNLADNLGFTDSTGSASTHTASRIFDISTTRQVYIQSNILTSAELNGKRQNILCKVPLNTSFGAIITYKNESENSIVLDNPQDISSLDFKLINKRNEALDLNGLNWSMTLNLISE
jgi:hypothetical protein